MRVKRSDDLEEGKDLAWFVDLNGLLVHGMELDIVMRSFKI